MTAGDQILNVATWFALIALPLAFVMTGGACHPRPEPARPGGGASTCWWRSPSASSPSLR